MFVEEGKKSPVKALGMLSLHEKKVGSENVTQRTKSSKWKKVGSGITGGFTAQVCLINVYGVVMDSDMSHVIDVAKKCAEVVQKHAQRSAQSCLGQRCCDKRATRGRRGRRRQT